MSKPDDFIINSDFASLGQGGELSVSISSPSSLTIGSGQVYMNSQTLVLPSSGHLRVKVNSPSFTGTTSASMVGVSRQWSMPSSPNVAISFTLVISRVSESNISIVLTTFNPYSSPITLLSGPIVFNINIKELVLPF